MAVRDAWTRLGRSIRSLPWRGLSLTLPVVLFATRASADVVPASPPPAPTFGHELSLLVLGAIFGAFLGPIGQMVIERLFPSKDLKVRREEVAALKALISSLNARSDTQVPQPTPADLPVA